MIEIKYTRLPHGEGLPLPVYASEHAAGLDVVSAEELVLAARATARGSDRLRDRNSPWL